MNLRQVLVEPDPFDHTHGDIAEPHLGLVRQNARCIVKHDLHNRALVIVGLEGHPDCCEQGREGHDPDPLHATQKTAGCMFFVWDIGDVGTQVGVALCCVSIRSQIRRGSKLWAESMVNTTDNANVNAATPGVIEAATFN